MLEDYLRDGAYRFQMQFGKGSFADFYGRSPSHRSILAERRRWLAQAEARYLATLPAAGPLLDETFAIVQENGVLPESAVPLRDLRAQARFLGENWEPDYLLLRRDGADLRLVCGCVCFPSSWALDEKIGRSIEKIHEIVPGLNASIGRQIHVFLERIKPGVLWTRTNWGLSRWPDLNQHPSRRLPPLRTDSGLDETFFRVEEQSLFSLPQTGGILFGIRLKVFSLRAFPGTVAGRRLCLALETMPDDVAVYKGLAGVREHVVELLRATGPPE